MPEIDQPLARLETDGVGDERPAFMVIVVSRGLMALVRHAPEHYRPAELACPQSGLYREVNEFGTPTRRTAKAGAARG